MSKSSQPPDDPGAEGYSYTDGKTGKTIHVPKNKVKDVKFLRRGKEVTQHRYEGENGQQGKFVKKEEGGIDFDVVEIDGNHSLTYWAYSDAEQKPPTVFGRVLPATPGLIATSRVRIGGGNMDFQDVDSASYAAFFAPVDEKSDGSSEEAVKNIRNALGQFQIPQTGLNNVDQAIRSGRDKLLEVLNMALLVVGRALH
jgi:hypothetical protein